MVKRTQESLRIIQLMPDQVEEVILNFGKIEPKSKKAPGH